MVIWCAQVGKKKTQDVQFYTEVMEVNQAIDAGRRSMYDPDELEEEQRERDTRNRVRSRPLPKTIHQPPSQDLSQSAGQPGECSRRRSISVKPATCSGQRRPSYKM